MAEEQQSPPGSFCWVELMTRDVEKAKRFYSQLVGWDITDGEAGGQPYSFLTPSGADKPVGGMMQMQGPQFEGVPPSWLAYILVTDIEGKAARCAQLGGSVHCPPTEIPGIGRFCVIQDPTGAVIALFEAP